jgi:hypothetical protein
LYIHAFRNGGGVRNRRYTLFWLPRQFSMQIDYDLAVLGILVAGGLVMSEA